MFDSNDNLGNKKKETHDLSWVEPEKSRERQVAGVAFYEEEYGEYRLKLDMFPLNQYYLKAIGSKEGIVHYRAEVILKNNGKFDRRRPIGVGYSGPESPNDIFIELGPFSKILILSKRSS